MTAPDSTRALVARLADALVASYELDESVTADIARYKAIAAAAREPATDGLLTQQREGQGAEEHMATGSLRGAPPAPAPSRADDVEKTRAAIVEIVLTQLTTLGRMKDTDGWAATGHHLALLLDDALRPLAARLASQDARLAQFEALAERAHGITGDAADFPMLCAAITTQLAALAKGGA